MPNRAFLELALRLTQLYLEIETVPDTVYLEDVCLEIPGHDHETWLWRAGVNYFASAADRRWWHDHRIPGGIALPVNSVGHLVKSGKLANDQRAFEVLMGFAADPGRATKIDSLPKALEFAMRTIAMAEQSAPSAPATRLVAMNEAPRPIACPITLPPNLADRNYCEYEGWYHTDHTIPAPYFREDVERPSDLQLHRLDFTYLFRDDPDNPAFDTMGDGRRIRISGGRRSGLRSLKSRAELTRIESVPLLRRALSRADKPITT